MSKPQMIKSVSEQINATVIFKERSMSGQLICKEMFHGNANKHKLKLHLTLSRMTIVKMKKILPNI